MSRADFDVLVQLAMRRQELAGLQSIVEKELLHYEIFNALDNGGLLQGLVFQGGTSLRLCWGSERFSEDLDFAAGRDFDGTGMARIKTCIEESIGRRYGLQVTVKEPKARDPSSEGVAVSTWQVSVITAPGNPAIPQQRIKIELAAIPAYTREVVPLRKNYEFLEGTGTLIVPVESRSEILADKLVAFPSSLFDRDGKMVDFASRKIRHRDIWDIAWLLRSPADPESALISNKVNDYGVPDFSERLARTQAAVEPIVNSEAFKVQMSRFLDIETRRRTVDRRDFLQYLTRAVSDVLGRVRTDLQPSSGH
jgi:predicted nucleotidyltransferase component of viral defense system